jgi:phage-related protein
MANVLGLALKISADASQLKLTPVERALQTLGAEAAKVTSVFDQFTSGSAAAQRSQQQFATDLASLNSALKTGQITAQQFAEEFANLAEAAQGEADALREAARITESVRSPLERFSQTAGTLQSQLDAGRITQETYNRALEQASRGLTDADRAAAGLAARTNDISDAGKTSTLQFNELSGIFAVLPGPLGNIAGRLSGITSASEGLSRVFSGGLSQGVSSIATSFTSLLTPTNLAVAGIAALGAASTAVVQGLTSLEDRVERLGNLANQLGVSFGFVQDLEEAGNRTGVSVEQLEGSFARLQNTLASGGEESKKATEALGRLGIAAADLAELSQEDQIRLFGERIAAIQDPAERSAAAIALFGRSGVQLLPFFNNLATAADDVERFNARLSDIDRVRVDELGTAFDGVNVALRGFGQELLTPFIGITRSISEGLSPALTTLGQIIGSVFDALSPVTSAIGGVVNIVLQLGATVGRIVGTVLEPFAAIGRVISGAFDAASQTFTVAFSAINRVVDSVRGFLQFSAPLAAIGNVFSGIATTISNTLAPVFERLSEIGTRVSAILTAAFDRLSSFFAAFVGSFVDRVSQVVASLLEVTGISDTVTAVADAIGSAFGSAWDIIQGVAGTIGGLIERVLAFAEDWLGIVPTIEEPVEATIDVNTGDAIAELIAENKELGKLIDGITKSVEDAKLKSVEFGQEGFDAALRYQQGIDDLKEKLAGGFFNEEQFRIEAEKARVAFQNELDRISQDAKLEIQIEENAARTLEGLRSQINDVVADSAKLGQAGFDAALQYQSAIERLQQQFEQGILNETTLAAEAKKAREEYDLQVKAIEAATAAQQQQVDNDRKRIESLLQVNDAAQRITDDIASVDREIARVQEELARAEGELNAASAETARRRIDELEQLQSRLADDLQASAQGFEQGFDKAFEATGNNFARLAERANEFGQAGIDAAARLQEGIAAAQEQARDGILNREAFEAEVARRQQLFEQEIEQVKAVADERKRVNDFVDQQFNLARFGGDQQRLEAANRVAEIEREIIRVQGEVQAARNNGDQAAVNAGIQRLGLLDQVGAKEANIASGRQQLEQQIAEQRDQYLKQLEEQQKQAQQQQQAFLQQQQKALEAEQARQTDRLRELNTLGAGVIEGSDIRTSEGAALFLQLAAQQQDPALIEARLQTRRLTEIRQAVVGLVEGLTGLPTVRIPGALG